MKKINFLSALLFTILFFDTGCKKEEPWPPDGHTIAQGRILEYGTDKPITGAMVRIAKYEGTIFGGGFSIPIDTVFTDENGFYYIDLKIDGALDLFAEADQYYPSQAIGIYTLRDNKIDIHVDPYAWLKLHVKNVTPIGEYDYIIADTNENPGTSSEKHIGPGHDITVIQKHHGNRNLNMFWIVRKDSVSTHYYDTIFIPAHDTTYYEILY